MFYTIKSTKSCIDIDPNMRRLWKFQICEQIYLMFITIVIVSR